MIESNGLSYAIGQVMGATIGCYLVARIAAWVVCTVGKILKKDGWHGWWAAVPFAMAGFLVQVMIQSHSGMLGGAIGVLLVIYIAGRQKPVPESFL